MSSSVPCCPRCNAAIPADAPLGLCPACVLSGAAIASGSGPKSRDPLEVPSLESVRAAFPHLEIVAFIGSGGMGVVYHARQPQMDRHVALKLLPQSLSSDPAFAERFNREARFLARLSHPNIVAVYDFGQSNGFCFLLMEFVDGVNLREAMRTGRFSPSEVLALVPGICDALQYAHSKGVLHRDIKPENLLLDAQGQVKIVDFGVAKLLGEDSRDITLTATGSRVGTPHYMAPEQVEKPSEVDHRADIYSLGVVLYELLTGELPLGRFAVPSTKAYLDARIDAIVLRALAKEREHRQQSADEVKADVVGLGSDTGDPPAPGAARKPSRRMGCLLGIPIVRSGPAGPEWDWAGLGIAWVGLVGLLMPWALVARLAIPGTSVAKDLTLTCLFVLVGLCPVLAAIASVKKRMIAATGTSLESTPVAPPVPRWLLPICWSLILWGMAWLAIRLNLLHHPPAQPGFWRVELGSELMLFPACVALWTGHRGWRRLATVLAGLVIGSILTGGISTLLGRILTTQLPPAGPPINDGFSLHSIGNLIAFVGVLLVLWAPAITDRFGPATPWIHPPWRKRLALVMLGMTILVPSLAGILVALRGASYPSAVTFEVPQWDPDRRSPEAVLKAEGKSPATSLLVVPTPQPRSAGPEDDGTDPLPNPSLRHQILPDVSKPEVALGALTPAARRWKLRALDYPRQVTVEMQIEPAGLTPFRILLWAGFTTTFFGLIGLYLLQPFPIPSHRMFRFLTVTAILTILIDSACRILT